MKKLITAVMEDQKKSGKPEGIPMGDQDIPRKPKKL